MHKPEASTDRFLAQQQILKQKLEQLLHENEHQQISLSRKIIKTKKKQQAQAKLLQLSDFLASFASKNVTAIINLKTPSTTDPKIQEILIKQELRYELLQYEKLLLESRLRKLNQTETIK